MPPEVNAGRDGWARYTNAADFLLAGKLDERIAIECLDAAFTYGHLRSAAGEFAARLLGAGLRKGDRVLVISANSFQWAAAYLGILQAGLVAVPLPGSISAQDLMSVVEATEPCAVFLQSQLFSRHSSALVSAAMDIYCEAPPAKHGWFQAAHIEEKKRKPTLTPDFVPDDLAALMFTSGSTGTPRGVMVSHRNLIANTSSIIASLNLCEHERMMTVLPFHYCFGASLLHTHLRAGATLVIDNRFTYPEVILEHIRTARCTSFAGVPSHYQILLRSSSLTRKSLPDLHTLLQAGGHLAPLFVRQLQEALPQARIFVMYGQTEATARLACMPPEFLNGRSGSIGKAIPGVTLKVIGESGEEAAPGAVGEIVAEGENVTLGYWRAPEETAHTFRDGKLHTGDLATKDEEGFLYIVDRTKEFVKCGGTRISCRQIEDRLLECEELLEAAVIGVPDEILGEAVRAFVVPRRDQVEGAVERLRTYAKANLPRTMIPRDIVVLKSLPKNSSGKVLRAQLKTLAVDVPVDRGSELAAIRA